MPGITARTNASLSIPAFGDNALPFANHSKPTDDGTSHSLVACDPSDDDPNTGSYFRGFGLPISADDIGGLPTEAQVTFGSGKSATTVDVALTDTDADGEPRVTGSGNPKVYGSATHDLKGGNVRIQVQVSERKGGTWLMASVVRAGGGGRVADSNPFA